MPFIRIRRNIARLRKEGIEVALRVTVTSYNVDYMVNVARHHQELDGAGCAFVALNPVNSDKEIIPIELLPDPDKFVNGLVQVYEQGLWNMKNLYPLNEYAGRIKPGGKMQWGCGAPFGNTPVIDEKGDVYACIWLVGIKDFYLGNIFEGYPDESLVAKMVWDLHVDNIEECKDCPWKYLCGGGCPVKRLTVDNNPNATAGVKAYCHNVTCKTTKALAEIVLWEMAKKRYTEVKSELSKQGGDCLSPCLR